MKHTTASIAVVFGSALLLSGCSGRSDYEDLSRFMSEVRARPVGQIESLPVFTPYESFTYHASNMRSPFELPDKVQMFEQQGSADVRPDTNRAKQFLEGFPIDHFTMVGTLSNDEGIWGLVRMDGSIYRVRVGDYIGQNHGRVIAITEKGIQLLEIIPRGAGAWVERPRELTLTDK